MTRAPLGDLEFAIVRVLDSADRFLGTAFFISPTQAITCAHVITTLDIRNVRLSGAWAGGGPKGIRGIERPENASLYRDADVARIEVNSTDAVRYYLPVASDWPVIGQDLFLCGYSSPREPLEQRKFSLSSNDTSYRLFAIQDRAAPGNSGSPILDSQNVVVGIASFINDRNLTFCIPYVVALNNLPGISSVVKQGDGPIESPPKEDHSNKACVSSQLGSIHLHIYADDVHFVNRLIDAIDPDAEQSTYEIVEEGPTRCFSTTQIHTGPNAPDHPQRRSIEHTMRLLLGSILVEGKADRMNFGAAFVDAERVIATSLDGKQINWLSPGSEIEAFGSEFMFPNLKRANDERFGLHILVDVERRDGSQPAVNHQLLAEACASTGLTGGTWVRFLRKDRNSYRYRANGDRAILSEVEKRFRLFADYFVHRNIEIHVRMIIEEVVGQWKFPFEKLDDSNLTIPELAHWEESIPPNSTFLCVTGNFLGDRSKQVEDAMIKNLGGKSVKYKYFLRSFADLNRWLRFRSHLEQRLGMSLKQSMDAFVYEFKEENFWPDNLDCFILISEDGARTGYKLSRESGTERVLRGKAMSADRLNEIDEVLNRPFKFHSLISSRRNVDDVKFQGVVVWLDFGLFELFAQNKLKRSALAQFVEEFDYEASVFVSRYGGEVHRSNEVGFVAVLPCGAGGELIDAVKRSLRLVEALVVSYTTKADKLFSDTLGSPYYYRAALECGEIRRTVRSNGRGVDGDPLRDCRACVAKIVNGHIYVLPGFRNILNAESNEIGDRVVVNGDGKIDWNSSQVSPLRGRF